MPYFSILAENWYIRLLGRGQANLSMETANTPFGRNGLGRIEMARVSYCSLHLGRRERQG